MSFFIGRHGAASGVPPYKTKTAPPMLTHQGCGYSAICQQATPGRLLLNITVLQVPVAVGAVPSALQRGALQPEVGVVSNGDGSGVLHQDVLSLVQLLEVDSLVSDLGSLNGGIELRVVVLTIVVAVGGAEQLDHVGRIVVVHDPAVTADIIVAGAAQGQEAGPLDLVDVHGDTQVAPSLLDVLSNGDVVTGIVSAVGDGGEAFAIGITSLSQQALGFLEVCLVVIADVALAAVGVVVEHAGLIDDAGANEVVSRLVGALHDGVGNVVTVDGQAQSLTDLGIRERLALVVQADVVGAQDGVDIEVAAVLSLGQAGDLIGGNVLDQLGRTAVVSGVGSAGVLQQEEGDGVRDDLAGIPATNIVGVLAQNDTLGGGPLGDHVGAVADEGIGLGAPGIAVSLNGGLLDRAHSGKSAELVKVGAGVRQLNGQGLAVLAGMDVQGIPVGIGGGVAVCIGVADGIVITVDHADNGLAVGGSGVGAGQTLEGVLEILSGQVRTIAPLQAVLHGEGPGQAVLADFRQFSLAGNNLVVLVDQQQGLEGGDDGVGTVDGSVQGRVQGRGVGAELDGKAVCGSAGSLGGFGGFCGRSRTGSSGVGGSCGRTAGSQGSSHAASHSHGGDVLHLHW